MLENQKNGWPKRPKDSGEVKSKDQIRREILQKDAAAGGQQRGGQGRDDGG